MGIPTTSKPIPSARKIISGLVKIAVLIQASNNFNRRIILGASAYSRMHGGWDFLYPATSINGLQFPKGEVSLPEGWDGDGILFRGTSDALWSKVQDAGCPAVNVSWRGLNYDQSVSVVADPAMCGEMVASYIASKQFQVFGYVGVPHWQGYPSVLFDTIQNILGPDLLVFEFPDRQTYRTGLRQKLCQWVQELPKPIGIVTWSTDQARILISICLSRGISIPDEVSIVTCEYDELSAALAPISISGVFQNPNQVGFEAAKTLHGIMSGRSPAPPIGLVPPVDVIERESSKVVAFYDVFTQNCMRLIDQNLAQGINATKLASEMDVSRRTLEIKLARTLDKSPSAVIDEFKLRKAKRLLSDTNLFLDDIARRTGFSSPSAFTRFFKRNLGCAPSKYRAVHASGDFGVA